MNSLISVRALVCIGVCSLQLTHGDVVVAVIPAEDLGDYSNLVLDVDKSSAQFDYPFSGIGVEFLEEVFSEDCGA